MACKIFLDNKKRSKTFNIKIYKRDEEEFPSFWDLDRQTHSQPISEVGGGCTANHRNIYFLFSSSFVPKGGA